MPPDPRPRDAATGWTIAGLVLAGCALRLTGLGLHSIWFDEAGTLAIAEADDLVETISADGHPPISHLLFRAWIGLFGTGDATLRLLPALASCLALIGFARLAHAWLSAPARTWSVALYALAPFLIWNGQEVRMYTLVELGAVATLLATHAFIARPERRGLAWLGVAAGTAFTFGNHYLGALVGCSVVGVGAAAVAQGRLDTGRLVRLTAAPLVAGLAWLPWLVLVLPRQLAAGWAPQAKVGLRDVVELPARFVFTEGHVLTGPARLLVLGGGAAILAAVALHVLETARRRRWEDLRSLACFLAPIAGGLCVALVTTPRFTPRYLTVAAPGAILCAGAGIAALRWTWPRRALGALALAGCLVVLVALRTENRREDYRAACAELAASWRAGDRVLAICDVPGFADAPLSHYLRDRPEILASLEDTAVYFAGDRPALAAGTRLHVVYREEDEAWRQLERLVATHPEIDRGERRIRIQHLLFEVPPTWTEREAGEVAPAR